MRRTAALIVGGGPAGSAAAICLARRGMRPELIERTTGDHDMVCGGFLGWDALAMLRRLKVDTDALGARPIRRVCIFADDRMAETGLPHQAAGLSRRKLDSALLAEAEKAGALVTRGRTVKNADPTSLSVRTGDGEEIAPNALFLATGKHELRGLARFSGTNTGQGAIGLRTTLPASRLESVLEGTIELHLFNGGYAGLLLQEDGMANLCLSVSRSRLTKAGGISGLMESLSRDAPRLLDRIGNALPSRTWDAVAGVPYGWRARRTPAGLFRIGDQGAVIASLAGDGIAIALASGHAAAFACLSEGPKSAPAWQRRFSSRAARPLRIADMLRHSAERPAQRAMLMRLIGFAPGLMKIAARLTRIG